MTATRSDAIEIWTAGVASVHGERRVLEVVRVDGDALWIGDAAFPLDRFRRILVVGAGKAVGSMTIGLERSLGTETARAKDLSGWVNAPAGAGLETRFVSVHPARPMGVNEPTEATLDGTKRILRLLRGMRDDTLCFCLLSGGGSALLCQPMEGLGLDDLIAVTRFLSAAGADILQLNLVRQCLDSTKAGGLARAAPAGTLLTLMISDVFGDPMQTIASGPTVPSEPDPGEALAILEQYGANEQDTLRAVLEFLRERAIRRVVAPPLPPALSLHHRLVASNDEAVHGAADAARQRGFAVECRPYRMAEGRAEDVARLLIDHASTLPQGTRVFISGGEPLVELAPEEDRGRGGRNQQVILAAIIHVLERGSLDRELCLVSGGTDGEDGPTDAAGAVLDRDVLDRARPRVGEAREALRRNDAYPFLDSLGALVRTGPTHTNVCDLRVMLVD